MRAVRGVGTSRTLGVQGAGVLKSGYMGQFFVCTFLRFFEFSVSQFLSFSLFQFYSFLVFEFFEFAVFRFFEFTVFRFSASKASFFISDV